LSVEVSVRPVLVVVPGAPVAVGVLAADGVAQVVWSAPGSDGGSAVSGYRVYRGTSPGGEVLLASVGAVSGFTDSGVSNGVSYYYRVSAVNVAGEGPLSVEVGAVAGALVSLDAFDRADENPLSDAGRWLNGVATTGEQGLRVSGGQLASVLASTASAWRGDRSYGPDGQVWARIPVLPGAGAGARLYARLQAPGSSAVDGYMLRFNQLAGTDQVLLVRLDNSALVTLATANEEIQTGDRLLLRLVGSSIEAWRQSAGGAWSRLAQANDSTYPAAGMIGLALRGTSGRLDDFGGR
jgi:hypothetical protein